MAEKHQQFGYHSIVLLKSETLGSGSYGGVCMAKCDGLLCAAKIMHPTLFDLRDPGTTSYLRRFEEECRLLSLARHPNIVQYLTTYRDPETHLPVLVMELCDESLCRFLERSVGPLPYHTELNISHDIALALVYLHSNGLIHRDLTGNNVLMIAGIRAKVTDFGMSKLASVNPRMTPLTLCPGNLQYMSPEALEEPPSYTEKLDIFSFGVLLVQIMTRQFPNPGPRFQVDPRYPDDNVRVMVPETQRRSAHLQLISSTHSLKPIALNCLNSKERERSSAQHISKVLSLLKQTPQYEQSKQQTQNGDGNRQELELLRRQLRDLQKKEEEQQKDWKKKQQLNQEEKQEYKSFQLQLTQQIRQLKQQLREQKSLIEAKTTELQQLHDIVEQKDEKLQEQCHTNRTKTCELQSYEQLVSQLQDLLGEKNKTISDLESTVSANNKKIQHLELQVNSESSRHQLFPHPVGRPRVATVTGSTALGAVRWEEMMKAPEKMWRGAAVIDGNTAFINPRGSHKFYSCQINSRELLWSSLPNNPYCNSSLAIISGHLTSIGGYKDGFVRDTYTGTLLSLKGEDRQTQWTSCFPPMPTARIQAASVTTEQTLVVAGGYDGQKTLDIVEMMIIPTKQWITVSCLPHPFGVISGCFFGGQLYLGGGSAVRGQSSKSVLTCSLNDLSQPQTLGVKIQSFFSGSKPGVWREIKELPVTQFTLATLGGHLLAIGGKDDSGNPTANVHYYDNESNTWHVITKMKSKRYECLAVVLPMNQILVMGGRMSYFDPIDSVEIASLL